MNPLSSIPGLAARRLAAWTTRLAMLLATATLLAACASPQPADYAALTPRLDLRSYFDGPLVAHGIVTDRNGRLLQRFTVQLTGRWQGNTGTLDERFTYADGRQEQRVWTLTRLDDGRYTGRAADVVGDAVGQAAGPALNWRYTLRLPVDGRTWDLELDDWMFLVDDQVMINRAQMRKFGLLAGEVLIAFRRQPV
jgi:Protein of unknown function (DUF3833)